MNQPWPTLTWINPLRPTLSPDLHILYISEIWQWWNWGPLSSTGGGGRTSLRIFHPPSQLGHCRRSLPVVIASGHRRRSSPAVIAGGHRRWSSPVVIAGSHYQFRIQLAPVKSSLCKQPSWMKFLLSPFITKEKCLLGSPASAGRNVMYVYIQASFLMRIH